FQREQGDGYDPSDCPSRASWSGIRPQMSKPPTSAWSGPKPADYVIHNSSICGGWLSPLTLVVTTHNFNMKARDLFGVVVRVIGLILVLYAIWNLSFAAAITVSLLRGTSHDW